MPPRSAMPVESCASPKKAKATTCYSQLRAIAMLPITYTSCARLFFGKPCVRSFQTFTSRHVPSRRTIKPTSRCTCSLTSPSEQKNMRPPPLSAVDGGSRTARDHVSGEASEARDARTSGVWVSTWRSREGHDRVTADCKTGHLFRTQSIHPTRGSGRTDKIQRCHGRLGRHEVAEIADDFRLLGCNDAALTQMAET